MTELEQLRKLASMVRKMRVLQRVYFSTRLPDSLLQAKQVEREVDRLLRDLGSSQTNLSFEGDQSSE